MNVLRPHLLTAVHNAAAVPENSLKKKKKPN